MAIYNKGGNTVSSAFSKNGTPLSAAYNKNGETVFSSGSQLPDYSSYSYTQKWASKGISNTQGFAIYDDKVFWISKSGNSSSDARCYVWNLSDGSQALSGNAYFTAYTGHGNNLTFSDEFYADGDAFPLLLASTAYANPSYLNRITNEYAASIIKKYSFPVTTDILGGGYDVCYGDTTDIVYTASVFGSNSNSSLGTHICIAKWDMTDLTENEDGTFTPAFVSSVNTDWHYWKQGIKYHDGMIWLASGYPNFRAYVYAIDPNTGETKHTIDCETTTEIEGAVFYPDEDVPGGYALYVGFQGMMMRKYTFAQEEEMHSTYRGKTLSILGDSISTYSGYIPSGNTSYYPTGTIQDVTDTWWYKLMTALEMTLNVNNSYSGSRVTTTNGDTSAGCGTRAESLGTAPDVIIIWMGINDFNNEVALGTYDGKSAVPSTTTTFREAYGNMLNKVLTAYPSAEVWCCTLPQCERNGTEEFPEINGNNIPLADFNAAITELAKSFGVKVLDHNRCGLTYQNMDVYNPDELHPNKYGHSLVANNDIRQMDNAVRTRYAIA